MKFRNILILISLLICICPIYTFSQDSLFLKGSSLLINNNKLFKDDNVRNGLCLNFKIKGKGINGLSLSFIISNSSTNGSTVSIISAGNKINGLLICPFTFDNELTGLNISLYNQTDITGLSIGLINRAKKEIRGAQLGLFNINGGGCKCCCLGTIRGIQIGLLNKTQNNYGLQFGIINKTTSGKGIQIGLINIRKNNPWYSRIIPIINFKMDDRQEYRNVNDVRYLSN